MLTKANFNYYKR